MILLHVRASSTSYTYTSSPLNDMMTISFVGNDGRRFQRPFFCDHFVSGVKVEAVCIGIAFRSMADGAIAVVIAGGARVATNTKSRHTQQ